ncbi:MarR family winged helix-turn-helix transcriptional regulator [Geodermatophilus sp. DSM 44513]|uniref:MarR family winged helix-turn-helix transcriptional regulator n=1 Tax=Geodermatophilus sp. DSM 44513 TaxID=1528104 RepID=UPI0012847E10|nr:MarR family transcriptional regulator [Geodermatophilus sp. DSM 44513]WNV73821.1 MarR family transcriptional regulator [Geodermatophilus sp. DSM 44513]
MPPDTPHVDLLRQVATGLAGRVQEILASCDLTLDQWRVLRTLDEGPLSMSDLSTRTRIPAPTATRVVDRLVERSLVYRNVDAADRRRVLVHAAERGRALCRSLAPRIADAERDGLAALSAREAATLRRLLERLATG